MRTALALEDLVMNKIALVLFLLGGLALAGCDGEPPMADGGPGDGGTTDAPAQPDAPRILETRPADGEREVARDAAIEIVFDRAMDESAGALSASTDEGAIALEAGSWDEDGRVFTARPSQALPPGATLDVSASGFESAEGASLTAEHAWSFETRDDVAPFVTSATPGEGASAIDPDLDTIVIAFSEMMRDGGVARLEGGPGTLGRGTWMDGALHLPVEGLAADTAYRVVLEGFRDAAGNALDGAPVLGDGALDFTTGEDVTAPVVVDANPSEGQLDVRVGLVTRIALDFSEPMDTTAGSATLEVDGGSEALSLEWSRGDTRVSLPVASLLRIDSPHRVVLDGFRDRAGNAHDGAVYLGDGALDFTTGEGALSPFVAHTEPLDALEVSAVGITVIRVVFSEAMDRSQTTAVLADGSLSRTLNGTWNEAGTVLTLDARGYVHASSPYTMDLSGFTDATGSPVDVSHPYLGDGILQFTTPAGTGERCGDELGMDVATPITGGVEWVIPSGAVSFDDGAASCRQFNGGADAVVHYRKTTASAADGGMALRVTASNPTTSNDINLAVFFDRCDVGDAATMRRCVFNRNPWETFVDGGPGDYFIWVGRTSSTGSFNGATVRVEEVAMPDEGETCLSALDTTTDAPIYTAPEEPGDPQRWTIPASFAQSFDVGVGIGMPGAISCAPNLRHGPDTVVRLDKSTATSLISVRARGDGVRTGISSPAVPVYIEVLDSCGPSPTSLACFPGAIADHGFYEATIEGAAGPRYVWVGANATDGELAGATIEALEFEPQPGDSCATAIPLTPGTPNTVTATRPHRAFAPECLSSGGLTWFRFTTRQSLTVLNTNGPTVGAVVDATTGQVLRCGDDGQSEGVPVFAPPGTDVCVALSSSDSVTQIAFDEIPYNGVRGVVTDLRITRPTTGSPPSITASWVVPMAGRVWNGQFQRILHAPLTGGDYSWHQHITSPNYGFRYAGMVRPDGIYALTELAGATTPRLYRIVDAAGTPLETPEPIDVLPDGFAYPTRRLDGLAFDGTQFIVGTSSSTGTSTEASTYYSIPAAGGAPTLLGTNDSLHDVGALAADADYLYVAGRVGSDEGIWRLRRDQLSDPAQTPHQVAGGVDLVNDGASIAVDDTTAATVLYFRTIGSGASSAHIHVVIDPRAATPRWVGKLWRAPGNRQDNNFGYDPIGRSIYLVHTNGDTKGFWLRLD